MIGTNASIGWQSEPDGPVTPCESAITARQLIAFERIGIRLEDAITWSEKRAGAFLDRIQRIGGYTDAELYGDVSNKE